MCLFKKKINILPTYLRANKSDERRIVFVSFLEIGIFYPMIMVFTEIIHYVQTKWPIIRSSSGRIKFISFFLVEKFPP